jgi:hypothetical protein
VPAVHPFVAVVAPVSVKFGEVLKPMPETKVSEVEVLVSVTLSWFPVRRNVAVAVLPVGSESDLNVTVVGTPLASVMVSARATEFRASIAKAAAVVSKAFRNIMYLNSPLKKSLSGIPLALQGAWNQSKRAVSR